MNGASVKCSPSHWGGARAAEVGSAQRQPVNNFQPLRYVNGQRQRSALSHKVMAYLIESSTNFSLPFSPQGEAYPEKTFETLQKPREHCRVRQGRR